MYFSIDRIVQGSAALVGEDGKPLEVPQSMLPQGAKEGDMLLYHKGVFTAAPEKTAERRKQVADMLAHLLGHPEDAE